MGEDGTERPEDDHEVGRPGERRVAPPRSGRARRRGRHRLPASARSRGQQVRRERERSQPRSRRDRTSVGWAAALALAACTAATPPTPARPVRHALAGRLELRSLSISSGEGLRWEPGALVRPDGSRIRFAIEGLEIGTAGFDRIELAGEVYDLHSPAQLAGRYVRALAAVPGADDPGTAVLRNEHGVLLVLRARSGEVPVGPGRDGVVLRSPP